MIIFHTRCLNRAVRWNHTERTCRHAAVPQFSKIVAAEVWQHLEIAHPGATSTPRHYRSHPEMHFPARTMAGDPCPPIAEQGTFPPQDRSISFGLRPSEMQNSIFALVSPSSFEPGERSDGAIADRSLLRMANPR
jgi:hypothetical protein